MARIDYFFAVLSPFAYLANDRLERLAERHGATIEYHVIDIIAVGNATGWTPPPKRHPARVEYRTQELRRLAARESLPINLKPAHWPTDPVPASSAFNAARMSGAADPGELVRSILRAVWAEERDISDPQTVRAILRENAIDPEEVEPHMEAGKAQYERDTAEAPERGVFGVPFYLVGDERFWGQDRLDLLDLHLGGQPAP